MQWKITSSGENVSATEDQSERATCDGVGTCPVGYPYCGNSFATMSLKIVRSRCDIMLTTPSVTGGDGLGLPGDAAASRPPHACPRRRPRGSCHSWPGGPSLEPA